MHPSPRTSLQPCLSRVSGGEEKSHPPSRWHGLRVVSRSLKYDHRKSCDTFMRQEAKGTNSSYCTERLEQDRSRPPTFRSCRPVISDRLVITRKFYPRHDEEDEPWEWDQSCHWLAPRLDHDHDALSSLLQAEEDHHDLAFERSLTRCQITRAESL